MNEKSILFNAREVEALLNGKKINKKIYAKNGENPLSKDHLIKRLLNGAKVDEQTGCWVWEKTRNNHGYGTLTINKKSYYAHRLSFELFYGDIPENLFVLHECDNPACINPNHLHIGTQVENMRECYERGRSSIKPISLRGENNGQAKLSQSDVEKIRNLLFLGETQSRIADVFGISQSQISNIKRGLKWA